MCGIVGLVTSPGTSPPRLERIGDVMARSIAHRGPDHQGLWSDTDVALLLGYRRLAIQDLSPAGTQPMHSASDRHVLVFNGEIYDFHVLRSALEGRGRTFRGHSDTEVLVEAIDEWGVGATLQRLRGMFAFALWDRRDRRLTLARDQLGKKPLYYGRAGKDLLFGSELKALIAHPEFRGTIDRPAVQGMLRYGWFSGASSVFREVRKVPPGAYVEWSATNPSDWSAATIYWSAVDAARAAADTGYPDDLESAVDRLEHLLQVSVGRRMIADVELGALLSGGVDSTLVAGVMQKLSDRPVKTFSIGFSEPKYDEAPFAAAIARHLGTDHTELYIGPEDLLACVPRIPRIYDEPFGDPSAVPTSIVTSLAGKRVKAALTGDGGDEFFGGYGRYRRCVEMWQAGQRWPEPVRRMTCALAAGLEATAWRSLRGAESSGPKEHRRLARYPAKLAGRLDGWNARTIGELYTSMRRHDLRVAGLVHGLPAESDHTASLLGDDAGLADPARAIMMRDVTSYLPENNLVKVDRASMAVGLELRSPLLDLDVVEFAWALPTRFLLDGAVSKRILRSVLARYVPPQLWERPKRGFGVPIGPWLKTSLRDWAEGLLDPQVIDRGGILNARSVQTVWRQHISGWRDHKELLWNILMFQAWWQDWQSAIADAPRP